MDRLRASSGVSSYNNNTTSTTTGHEGIHDLTPRKSLFVVVIVVGCFAVLWPRVFYPMLVGPGNNYIKPNLKDRTSGCCDVISETDVNTIKIMSELCSNIIVEDDGQPPLSEKEIVTKCKNDVLETCGIDISAVLQEQVRLGQSVKQIIDEVRSLNGSLCLKYNFGVQPWRLGVPHRITIKTLQDNVRQERPPHLRPEIVHPAFKERGRAIPQTQTTTTTTTSSPSRPPPRIVEGRPGPIPGMRPTMGGPGHVVQAPKQGAGSMGFIMPIYTIGIVIFFSYTVVKIIFKKQPETVAANLYPQVEPDVHFRQEVFVSEPINYAPQSRSTKDTTQSKIGDAELDQLRRRLRETEIAMERIVEQMAKVPLKMQDENLANGNAVKPKEPEQPSVKIVGMEMTASCEGGKKWSRPESPVLPSSVIVPAEPIPPPQEIFLEGALPPQSQLLVTDSATEEQNSNDDTPIVLSGKMTLSVISLDSNENGSEESNDTIENTEELNQVTTTSNIQERIDKIKELKLDEEIDKIIEKARNISTEVELAKEKLLDINEVSTSSKDTEEIVPNNNGVEETNSDDEEEDEETDEEIEEVEYEDDSDEEELVNEVQNVDRVQRSEERQLFDETKNNGNSPTESESEDEESEEIEEIVEYVDEDDDDEGVGEDEEELSDGIVQANGINRPEIE